MLVYVAERSVKADSPIVPEHVQTSVFSGDVFLGREDHGGVLSLAGHPTVGCFLSSANSTLRRLSSARTQDTPHLTRWRDYNRLIKRVENVLRC
jgi:hypothetical protein